ncbi:hypothetical protein CFB89_04150 [Burkholderia sp. AU16741]|nr:hypothetical protein CFB89_04150 [Burkholderia sp. AU16741]
MSIPAGRARSGRCPCVSNRRRFRPSPPAPRGWRARCRVSAATERARTACAVPSTARACIPGSRCARPLPTDALERIADLRRHACEGADFDEGLRAFAERRAPVFRGV